MFYKVYCFLARAVSLLAYHVSLKYTEQTVKRYHGTPLDFPQILLTATTFSFSFTFLIYFVFLFFQFLLLSVCTVFFCLKQKIYILVLIRLCGRLSNEKFSPSRFPEIRSLFFSFALDILIVVLFRVKWLGCST